MTRAAAVLLATGLAAAASTAGAEGVTIDHQVVGCLVAGRHPRLNACFAPTSRLARARVYFRVADGPADWYYVEMKSDAPCFAGVLPRPKKELVGRSVRYYLDAFDRTFVESRTAEAEARIVGAASECDPKQKVAPVLDGARVAVFPGMPPGFAGGGAGLGTGTLAAVLGGAAVAGGGVALAARGAGDSGPSSQPPSVVSPPETLPTTSTTTTTLPASGFSPVFEVLKGTVLQTGDTVSGTEPLSLRFDMCETRGPYRIRYGVEVDGVQLSDRCASTLTFSASGASPGLAAATPRRSATSRTFDVRMTIRSEAANNDPKANRRLSVVIGSAGAGCGTDKTGPAVSLSKPSDGSVYPSPSAYPVHLEAAADDSTAGDNGIAFVEYKVSDGVAPPFGLGPVTGGGSYPLDWTEARVNAYLGSACSRFLDVQAYAEDGCGNGSFSAKAQIIVNNTGNPSACPVPDPGLGGLPAPASGAWLSELRVPRGAAQVVFNGEAAFPREGRSALAARVERGRNRVEGTLVEGAGPGEWRFELGALPGLRADSVQVVAGEVIQVGGGSVVFRLRGRPGERVVFSFVAER